MGKIGDLTYEELGLRVTFNSQIPILPLTRNITYTIPGRHGAYDFGADLSPLSFELDCTITARNPIEVQKKARELTAHLLNKRGKPNTIKFVSDVDPDKFYWVRYAGDMPADRLYHMGRFTLPLTAHDPHAYANVTNNELRWGSQVVTFESDYLLGSEGGETRTITYPQSINVVTSGFIAVRPIFKISGSAENVAFQVNGKLFSLGSFSNVNWVIDGGKYTVTKDGERDLTDFEGHFLEFFRGDNELAIIGSGLDFTLEITFRDKYM